MNDPVAWLQTQPCAGTAAAEPARWAVLQGLARRAATQADGPLRAALLSRLQERLMQWQAEAWAPAAPRHRLAPLDLPQPAAEPRELRAAQLDRRGWTRLRVARRLAEPVARPAPAASLGPLHTQVLLPRALELLRELSPEYLERLLGTVDQLAALTAAPEATPPAPAARRGKLRP